MKGHKSPITRPAGPKRQGHLGLVRVAIPVSDQKAYGCFPEDEASVNAEKNILFTFDKKNTNGEKSELMDWQPIDKLRLKLILRELITFRAERTFLSQVLKRIISLISGSFKFLCWKTIFTFFQD